MRTQIFSKSLNRRAFLGAAGVAAAGAVGAACARDEYLSEPYRPASGAGAQGGDGHDAAPPRGAGRPEPTGDLQSIYDAAMPALDPAPVKDLRIDCVDKTVEVAGGVNLAAWTFDGKLPGTVVHVRQGDTINFTLTNSAAIGHSMDFHAAETPWNTNYRTIVPGETLTYTWTANWPGVFMYHCGTGPVLEHIANGMYGAIIVAPATPLEPAREYVLVQSEFYLKQGDGGVWERDADRMAAVQPDFVVFNGAASQYSQQPLPGRVGERIRLYVVNAGPTLFSAFHVIGAVFDKVYVDGNPQNVMRGISTWTIPPGGGATFELVIPAAGQYPFVTHSFAYTGLGAVGLLDVV
jgi:nitrite reductase (NO-forming)